MYKLTLTKVIIIIKEFNRSSIWQKGVDFLMLPESEWPVLKEEYVGEIPEQIQVVMKVEAVVERTLASRINIDKYSEYKKINLCNCKSIINVSQRGKTIF